MRIPPAAGSGFTVRLDPFFVPDGMIRDLQQHSVWAGPAAGAFFTSWFPVSKLGLQFADDLLHAVAAFGKLAFDLDAANQSALNAQHRAADWGVEIDGNGNIVGADGHLPIVIGGAILLPLGFLFGMVAVAVIESAINQMIQANADARRARQEFALPSSEGRGDMTWDRTPAQLPVEFKFLSPLRV